MPLSELYSELARVLIVDDLPDNLLALEAIIRQPGREIHQARGGEEALQLLLEHEFALAIIDVQMPGMNGFELAELMRGTARTRNIPIIFVSAGSADLNYPFRGYASGAIDFLYKPLDTVAVRGKVQILIELWQQRQAITRQVEALERSRQEQAQLLARLEQTQRELKQAVTLREDFMSIVAHELRTPLNSMILETQLRKLRLERNDLSDLSAEGMTQALARDERTIRSLIRLIDDMLDVSRIRNGKLTLRPEQLELTALIRDVVERFAHQLEAASCSVELTLPERIDGAWDGFRLEQILVNLLSNALRYGRGNPVRITACSDGDSVRVAVIDHGAGIDQQHHATIFRPFERACSTRTSTGLGLGLYICEQIAAAHGGRIELESAPGRGACFTLVLPSHCVETPPCAPSSAAGVTQF